MIFFYIDVYRRKRDVISTYIYLYFEINVATAQSWLKKGESKRISIAEGEATGGEKDPSAYGAERQVKVYVCAASGEGRREESPGEKIDRNFGPYSLLIYIKIRIYKFSKKKKIKIIY